MGYGIFSFENHLCKLCGPPWEKSPNSTSNFVPANPVFSEHEGRFPFSQKFRKFRFGAKWKMFSRFARLENSQKKWNYSKGSPVFPVGTSQWKFVFHLQNFSSLSPVSCLSRSFKRPGFPGLPRVSKKWRLIRVRFLEAFLLQYECALYKSGR